MRLTRSPSSLYRRRRGLVTGMPSDSSSSLGVTRPAYMSLPSPNMPCPAEQAEQRPLSRGPGEDTGGDPVEADMETALNLLERRGALVPPKINLSQASTGGRDSA